MELGSKKEKEQKFEIGNNGKGQHSNGPLLFGPVKENVKEGNDLASIDRGKTIYLYIYTSDREKNHVFGIEIFLLCSLSEFTLLHFSSPDLLYLYLSINFS